jgi:hypothetical protein
MKRWVSFTLCAVLGLLLLLCGWLIPAHLRAVEEPVLKEAGRNSTSLVGRGVNLVHIGQHGAGEIILLAAQHAQLPETNELSAALEAEAKKTPAAKLWGLPPSALKNYFPKAPKPADSNVTDFVVREDNRKKALDVLGASKKTSVQALLQSRSLTNTTTFAPSQSPGGEAFDTAVAITGILLDLDKTITPALGREIETAAMQANQTGNPEALEQALLDVLSIGQRFNWGQLTTFIGKIEDTGTLHDLAELTRNAGDQLPQLFAAVEISGDPAAVAQYLKTFHETGLKDLTAALPYGAGGVRALLRSNHRIYASHWREVAARTAPFSNVVAMTADYCWRMPEVALIVKWLLIFAGGFLLAMALHVGRAPASTLEAPLQVRGFHVAREFLFALGFLLVVLFLSEPFLAQEGATTIRPFRLRIPTAGSAIQPENVNLKTTFMDKTRLIPMSVFFVLQGLLYISSLVKLAEIRRQRVAPRIRLRLLENEDHLFDAGLYLGFLGTIIAFILSSVSQKHSFDLMVAYSSTSFGILFVSVFKIFNLRPVRRKLVLEAEAEAEPVAVATAAPAPSLAAP